VLKYWSIEKYQISSIKLQTNLKFQYSMIKTQNRFGISGISKPHAPYALNLEPNHQMEDVEVGKRL